MGGLTITDAVVTYEVPRRDPVTAVDHVDLEVADGEVVALLGPSGSGKSSLLRAIAGLEPLACGQISIGGRDLTGVPTARRGVGMMFQDAQLFGHMTVRRNVAYGLNSWSPAERNQRVDELLELVGLQAQADRKATQLSGGQAQRVALARALAPRPTVLLLDEPLASLDRALREHLTEVLATTLRATGTTAIHVTHDQDEAFALGHRVGVMMDGVLRRIDEPAALWRDPDDQQVARFLGYGPVIDAELAGRLGVESAGPVALSPAALRPASDGVNVTVTDVVTRRGFVDATVSLPDGQPATLRSSLSARPVEIGSAVTVVADPAGVVPVRS